MPVATSALTIAHYDVPEEMKLRFLAAIRSVGDARYADINNHPELRDFGIALIWNSIQQLQADGRLQAFDTGEGEGNPIFRA